MHAPGCGSSNFQHSSFILPCMLRWSCHGLPLQQRLLSVRFFSVLQWLWTVRLRFSGFDALFVLACLGLPGILEVILSFFSFCILLMFLLATILSEEIHIPHVETLYRHIGLFRILRPTTVFCKPCLSNKNIVFLKRPNPSSQIKDHVRMMDLSVSSLPASMRLGTSSIQVGFGAYLHSQAVLQFSVRSWKLFAGLWTFLADTLLLPSRIWVAFFYNLPQSGGLPFLRPSGICWPFPTVPHCSSGWSALPLRAKCSVSSGRRLHLFCFANCMHWSQLHAHHITGLLPV